MSTPATTQAREIFDLVRDDLAAIEQEFGRDTVARVRAITEIGEYLRGGGGKRIRPALLLLAAKLFNYSGRGVIQLGAVLCLPLYFRRRLVQFLKTFPKGPDGTANIITNPVTLEALGSTLDVTSSWSQLL